MKSIIKQIRDIRDQCLRLAFKDRGEINEAAIKREEKVTEMVRTFK